jgi:hypothetical protein
MYETIFKFLASETLWSTGNVIYYRIMMYSGRVEVSGIDKMLGFIYVPDFHAHKQTLYYILALKSNLNFTLSTY